jgi:hypothetical protein
MSISDRCLTAAGTRVDQATTEYVDGGVRTLSDGM